MLWRRVVLFLKLTTHGLRIVRSRAGLPVVILAYYVQCVISDHVPVDYSWYNGSVGGHPLAARMRSDGKMPQQREVICDSGSVPRVTIRTRTPVRAGYGPGV